jgi:Zn ribbon nucleic-acid-binding protein
MPDYKNGKIYKLWSPEGDEIYIGSTIQPLYARLSAHKTKGPTCSSKILFEKYDDVRIELIECVPCDNKEQLTKKEGEYIRKLDCVNRNIAGRT